MMYKQEVKFEGKVLIELQPCGMLYANGRAYFLLRPSPLEPDWETGLTERRFVVVPQSQIGQFEDAAIYPFARHIVATSWVVEYAPNMPHIYATKLLENDLFESEQFATQNDDSPIFIYWG